MPSEARGQLACSVLLETRKTLPQRGKRHEPISHSCLLACKCTCTRKNRCDMNTKLVKIQIIASLQGSLLLLASMLFSSLLLVLVSLRLASSFLHSSARTPLFFPFRPPKYWATVCTLISNSRLAACLFVCFVF